MTRAPRLALAAALLLAGACHKQNGSLPMPALGTSVLRLTRALHAELGQVSSDDLVAATLREKPELEKDFRGYTIRTRASGTNLVVLVRTKDGKYALFEDASWTPFVDKNWYETAPRHPADFTIDPASGPPSPQR